MGLLISILLFYFIIMGFYALIRAAEFEEEFLEKHEEIIASYKKQAKMNFQYYFNCTVLWFDKIGLKIFFWPITFIVFLIKKLISAPKLSETEEKLAHEYFEKEYTINNFHDHRHPF